MLKKYTPEKLIPALRLFVAARRKALDAGLEDNGGAIHSIERIVDLLSLALVYPHLSHLNNLKTDTNAPRSKDADRARKQGRKVLIEHVAPKRDYSKSICNLIENEGASNTHLINYIRDNYKLVLLTEEETQRLNSINRTKMSSGRLEDAGIDIFSDEE